MLLLLRRGHRRGRGFDSSVVKVDEGCRARAPLLGALSLALGNHPVPWRIVDNLDLEVGIKFCLHLHC